MKVKRSSYQRGSVYLRHGLGYWKWRDGSTGEHRSAPLGECGNKAEAWRKAQPHVLKANGGRLEPGKGITIGHLAGEYRKSDRFPSRFSTKTAYEYNLDNWILPKWRDSELSELLPMMVEGWLKTLELSAKTKTHLRSLLGILFDFAMATGDFPNQPNPMRLVRIKGASRRETEPVVLSFEQFHTLLSHVEKEPYRTMVLVAACLGLRFSELIALQWHDVDWAESVIRIRRGMVRNRVDDVKTRYSAKCLPLDKGLADSLTIWRAQAQYKSPSDWIWASPAQAGEQPFFYTTMAKVLDSAAAKAGLGELGWHAFRHSYRSWMDEVGVPIAIQQKLMRHSDIRTTMNVYGDVLPDTLREGNRKVVSMVLKTA